MHQCKQDFSTRFALWQGYDIATEGCRCLLLWLHASCYCYHNNGKPVKSCNEERPVVVLRR